MIAALTIVEPVATWLHAGPRRLHVHSAFPHAINLVGDDGQFLALLAEGADDGPFGLRLPCHRLADVPAGTSARVDLGTLTVDPLLVDWQSADRWDPTLRPLEKAPDSPFPLLTCLHESDSVFVHALFALSRSEQGSRGAGGPGSRGAREENPPLLRSSAPPLCKERAGLASFRTWHTVQAATHLAALRAGLQGDNATLAGAVRSLLGFGEGLTPAGDDLLLGLLAARRMLGQPAGTLEATIRGSTSRTTSLSAAFLRSACDGGFAGHWHRLRDALADEETVEIDEAARLIIAHGATSGADALMGWVVGLDNAIGWL